MQRDPPPTDGDGSSDEVEDEVVLASLLPMGKPPPARTTPKMKQPSSPIPAPDPPEQPEQPSQPEAALPEYAPVVPEVAVGAPKGEGANFQSDASPARSRLSNDSQTYEQFRESLGLPPVSGGPAMPIPLLGGVPAEERMAAMYGGVLMKFATDPELRSSMQALCHPEEEDECQRDCGTAQANDASEGGELDEDGVVGITLDPGGSRDITKSPQHHKLKLDNFVGGDDDDDDASSELEEGEWVDLAGESTGPSPATVPPAQPPPPVPPQRPMAAAAAAAASSDAQLDNKPSRGPVDPFQPQILRPPPRLLEKQQQKEQPPASADALVEDSPNEHQASKEQADDANGEDAISAFELDPAFDYDSIKITPRFSVAKALQLGEYYDRLLQEGCSPAKGPPMPHLS